MKYTLKTFKDNVRVIEHRTKTETLFNHYDNRYFDIVHYYTKFEFDGHIIEREYETNGNKGNIYCRIIIDGHVITNNGGIKLNRFEQHVVNYLKKQIEKNET